MTDFAGFLRELKKDQAKLEEDEERAIEQAESFIGLRRGDFADRTGFAGTVNVGDAVRRSDATVAAEAAGLAEDDPGRLAFEDALAAETETRALQTRTITGEQFRFEDALAALEVRLRDAGKFGAGGFDPLISDFGDFREEFDFFQDEDDFIGRAKASQEENRRQRQNASDRFLAGLKNKRNRTRLPSKKRPFGRF